MILDDKNDVEVEEAEDYSKGRILWCTRRRVRDWKFLMVAALEKRGGGRNNTTFTTACKYGNNVGGNGEGGGGVEAEMFIFTSVLIF